jgi:hypothetical protein
LIEDIRTMSVRVHDIWDRGVRYCLHLPFHCGLLRISLISWIKLADNNKPCLSWHW